MLARELPPQTLVDLLKDPFCVDEACRCRVAPDQLVRHYHRPFAELWDFVDHVRQQKLGLDLATPPSRSRMLPQVRGDISAGATGSTLPRVRGLRGRSGTSRPAERKTPSCISQSSPRPR